MNDVALGYLLDRLNKLMDTIPPYPLPTAPLPDKWIAASALQKGIRRGNVELVLRALDTLWAIDPPYARRRLAIVAFEEVGLGAPDIVGITVIACSGTKYIHKTRIYPAVKACAIALAQSPKERSAEHIYTILSHHRSLDLLRDRYAHKPPHELADIIIDPDRFLLERSAAAWLLSGTKRFGGGEMPIVAGDKGAYEWVIEQLNTPLWQPLVTLAGGRATQCALPVFWPIKLSQPDCRGGKVIVIEDNDLGQHDTSNIPPYLLDQFTRGGKAVIREILRLDTRLTRWLNSRLPRKAWQPTVEMGLFYISSDILDQEYTFRGGAKLRNLSVEADCCQAGLDIKDVATLINTLTDSLAEIDIHRIEYIRKMGW